MKTFRKSIKLTEEQRKELQGIDISADCKVWLTGSLDENDVMVGQLNISWHNECVDNPEEIN